MFKKVLFLVLFLLILAQQSNSIENKIIFKVENEIITSIDITDEFRYLQIINPNLLNLEKDKILQISKNSIIKEKIKKIEVMKYFENLEIDENYMNEIITNTYERIGLQNKSNFLGKLNENKINLEFVKKKLAINAKWNEIIFQKFRSKIKIDKTKLKEKILSNKENNLKSYNLSEILFEVNENENLNDKYKKIINDIQTKGFENSALIYSVSYTSTNDGGKIGWVYESSLNKNIRTKLNVLNIKEFSKPITVPGGFLILKVNDMKIEKKKINLEKELNLAMNLELNRQLSQFSNIYFNKIKKDIEVYEF